MKWHDAAWAKERRDRIRREKGMNRWDTYSSVKQKKG